MEFAQLDTIAQKVVRKLNGRIPLGTSREDAYQDAVVSVLKWEHTPAPAGVILEAFLVMKAWGDLKDKYARVYAEAAHIAAERAPLGRRSPLFRTDPDDEPVILNPRKTAPPDAPDADTVIDIQSAIDRLGEPGAIVVRMELSGASHTEIGAAFGYSRSWASRTLAAAKEQLKALLESYRGAED